MFSDSITEVIKILILLISNNKRSQFINVHGNEYLVLVRKYEEIKVTFTIRIYKKKGKLMKKKGFKILLRCVVAIYLMISLLGCPMQLEIYLVSFETNGGNSIEAESVLENEKAVKPISNPTKDGYKFDNWYTDNTFATEWEFTNPITKNTILYAKWTANNILSFNANDGSGTMESETRKTGEANNLPVNIFTRTGYSFAGWATSSDGSVIYADQASYTMKASNEILYAKWTADEHTLSFNANNGTGTIDSLTLVTDQNTTLSKNSFTREGYTFAGWATSNDGTIAYEDEENYKMD